MSYTPEEYTGDGSTTDFAVTFPYLAQAHVHAFVDGVEQSVTWPNAGTVRFSPAPANGTAVKITRATPTDLVKTYPDGGNLLGSDLNRSFKQNIYLSEESANAAGDALSVPVGQSYWDAETRNIRNVADGVVASDAATKGQLDAAVLTAGNVLPPVLAEVGYFLKATAVGTWAWGAVSIDLSPYAKLDGTNQPFTGDVTVSKTAPKIEASGAAGNDRTMVWSTAGSWRWAAKAGNTAESGANAGSNWELMRFSDAGSYLGSPIFVDRASGWLTFEGGASFGGAVTLPAASPTNANHATRKQYVDDAVAAIPTVQKFQSAQQTITAAGLVVVAHGLGGQPTMVAMELVCVTADGGFSPGNRIWVSPDNVDEGGAALGCALYADTTNVAIRFGTANGGGSVFRLRRWDTGVTFNAVNANWQVVIHAWK